MINVGIIGLGYWGPKYIRVLSELGDVHLKYLCDLEKQKLEKSKGYLQNIKSVLDYQEILKDPEIKAVIITTPPTTHYKIIKDSLEAGKDVFVEKPLTLNSKEGEEVVNLAKKKNLILMVGHMYLFNPGIEKIKSLIEEKELGEILYGIALRLGLSPIRKSASALWDLATHDLSVFLHLFGFPSNLSCTGESYFQKGIEDYVSITLRYPNKMNFSIYVSWFCPEKIRKITIIGTKKTIIFDDMNKQEMVKIYQKSFDMSSLDILPTYIDHQNIVREDDTKIPFIQQSEPLKNQIIHFTECITTRKMPLSDGKEALNVIKILEAADYSLKNKGKIVEIKL
jgi:predicted dehydrogenase